MLRLFGSTEMLGVRVHLVVRSVIRLPIKPIVRRVVVVVAMVPITGFAIMSAARHIAVLQAIITVTSPVTTRCAAIVWRGRVRTWRRQVGHWRMWCGARARRWSCRSIGYCRGVSSGGLESLRMS